MRICLYEDRSSFNRFFKMATCTIIILTFTICISIIIISTSHSADASENMEQHRIVIDTDAGIDDAVAILAVLGDPYYGRLVSAITCARGNTQVDKVAVNVLKILKIANRTEIPVYVGSAKGYIESPEITDYFGEDGLGDANYPEPPPLSLLQKSSAAEFLANIVNDYPGEVTVLALAPFTNLALATRLNPKFMSQTKHIYGLAGSIRGAGTMKPNVEFNAFMDPHAASITLQELSEAGQKMTLVPTDAIRDNFIDMQWRKMKLGSMKSETIEFLNRIEKKDVEGSGHNVNYWDTYDVYVATVMMRPEAIVERNSYYSDFETQGLLTKGMLVVDYNHLLNKTLNTDIVYNVDKKYVKAVCLDNLAKNLDI